MEEPIDGYVFDVKKLQTAIELYSNQAAIYNPYEDSYDEVSLARQILLDCQVFNDEKYTKLQKQVDAKLHYELVKQIKIKNSNFENDTTQFLYKVYGDGSQLQINKFNGLVDEFLNIDKYNDIESLASQILLSYGITSSDEIDEVSYGRDLNSFEDNELDKYAKEINDSNLKKEFIEQEVELQLLKKDFYFKDPVYGHRKIYAFLPSQPVPAGLEAINTKDMESFEKASLYASYICDYLYENSLDMINPALLMFKLEEEKREQGKDKGKDNFAKLESHLYHKAMLVHVDKEIYLLREDQEKLVSMIFPGKKITSVLMITKDKTGDVIYEDNNKHYDFTEEDVNKTLKYFDYKLKTTLERQEPYSAAGADLTSSAGDINNDGKTQGIQQDAELKVVGDHPYNTRSKAQKVKVKKENLGSSALKRDGEKIPEELLGNHTKKLADRTSLAPSKGI